MKVLIQKGENQVKRGGRGGIMVNNATTNTSSSGRPCYLIITTTLLLLLLSMLPTSSSSSTASTSSMDYTKDALNDEIQSLPGWDDDKLPSRMFSGHIDAGTSIENGIKYEMKHHYVFVESENDPSTDPVIVWTNGGPGASSMFGLFVELGPFYLSDASLKTSSYKKTKIPTLFYNDYTWTKFANVVILNGPPPVGYSYCNPKGPSGNGYSCGTWNDTKTSYHNGIFINNWIQRFPQFASSSGNNEWYLIGESYAGVYIPSLAREIYYNYPTISSLIKGFAVGDACVGTDVLCGANIGNISAKKHTDAGPLTYLEFFVGHDQLSVDLYKQIMKICPYDQLLGYGTDVTNIECQQLLKEAELQIGPYFAYSLYDDCWYENDLIPPTKTNTIQVLAGGESRPLPPPQEEEPITRTTRMRATTTQEGRSKTSSSRRKLGGLVDYPCGGLQTLFQWLVQPSVKDALHIAADAKFFSGDDGYGFTYNMTEKNLMPFYKYIVDNTNWKVLVYNGDTDPALTVPATYNWTKALNFTIIEKWRPWTIDGKSYLGGYVQRYENQFDYLTIRGSGHMVPQYKPKVTKEFITNWINNKNYKYWDGKTNRIQLFSREYENEK